MYKVLNYKIPKQSQEHIGAIYDLLVSHSDSKSYAGVDDVMSAYFDGAVETYLGKKSIAFAEISQKKSDLYFLISFACGELEELKEILKEIERDALEHGISRVCVIGRKGWSILNGYKETGAIYEKEL